MLRKIMVPLDMDRCHKRTVQMATALASTHGASVDLVHVVELVAGEPDPGLDGFYRKLEVESREHLGRLWAEAGNATVPHEERVFFGPRMVKVLELVASESYDLIVLSSHQIDPSKGAKPHMSLQIAGLAPCDVLLVKTLE